MTGQEFGDETLMAFVDGELDAAGAAWVERAMATDADVAARVAVFRRTRDALTEAARSRADEQVPEALMDKVRATLDAAKTAETASNVVPFGQASAPVVGWRMAVAASVVLVAGVLGGLILSQGVGSRAETGLRFADLDQSGFADALASVPSGERLGIAGGEIAPIASFLNGDGALCREFEYDGTGGATVVAVSCRVNGRWDMRFAVAAGSAEDGYAPASSLETLDAYLAASEAGAPMSPDEEAAALGALPR